MLVICICLIFKCVFICLFVNRVWLPGSAWVSPGLPGFSLPRSLVFGSAVPCGTWFGFPRACPALPRKKRPRDNLTKGWVQPPESRWPSGGPRLKHRRAESNRNPAWEINFRPGDTMSHLDHPLHNGGYIKLAGAKLPPFP